MSDAIQIRDAAFDLLTGVQINGQPIQFVRKVPLLTLQSNQLPCLSVFIMSEKEQQDGNVTIPQFVNSLELGISLVMLSSDPNFLDGSLDDFSDQVKLTLFRNTSFLQRFEYVTQVSREYSFPKDGETYAAELRMRITVTYRTRFEPYPTPYRLELFDMKTTPLTPNSVIIETQIQFN